MSLTTAGVTDIENPRRAAYRQHRRGLFDQVVKIATLVKGTFPGVGRDAATPLPTILADFDNVRESIEALRSRFDEVECFLLNVEQGEDEPVEISE